MKEKFKDVPGYEGVYIVGDKGSVYRIIRNGLKPLKGSTSKKGYKQFTLNCKDKYNVYGGHVLVAMAFLGHKPCGLKIVVDHIDNDKLNNNVENLRLLTNRENSVRYRPKQTSSKYIGVHWVKKRSKWSSSITINNKRVYLGLFDCEYKAHQIYTKAIEIEHLFNGDVSSFRQILKREMI